MLNARGRFAAAVFASGALHLFWLILPHPAPPPRQHGRTYAMHFEVTAQSAEPAPSLALETNGPPAERPRGASARLRVSSARVDASHKLPDAPADPAQSSAEEPASVGTLPARSSHVDLSPAAAARTLTAEQSSWKSVALEVPIDSTDMRDEARLAQGIAELTRTGHDRDLLLHTAQDVNSLVAKPWDLILQPLRGARYTYRGLGFDAIIQADGSVRYRTKDGVQLMFGQTKEIDGQPTAQPTVTLGLGFKDSPLPKLFGYDPHAGERRRFLERTRPLRELLHARALRTALARAAEHLRRELKAIEVRLEAGDATRAHTALFELWDACSEDEIGGIARRRIEAFARERCPLESNKRFGLDELVALNDRRVSKAPFAPYMALNDAGAAADASEAPP